MKAVKLFLVVLLFFVPLVLSGQIDTIHTVGGWKITKTSGSVTKAGSRVVTDTMVNGTHSQSFAGTLSDGASIAWEKKYPVPFQNISQRAAEMWVYAKKMTLYGYVHVYISFGDDSGYQEPFGFLVISADGSGFYPFNFDTPQNPKSVNRIKLEFVSRGTSNFEIFLDYFFLYGSISHPRLIIDNFEDTTVPVENEPYLPNSFKLFQNYPNPFNPSTVISYELSATSNVKIAVYDILGREVAVLVNEEKFPGSYEVKFNASNLPSGIYLYRLSVGNYTETRKMLLIK